MKTPRTTYERPCCSVLAVSFENVLCASTTESTGGLESFSDLEEYVMGE